MLDIKFLKYIYFFNRSMMLDQTTVKLTRYASLNCDASISCKFHELQTASNLCLSLTFSTILHYFYCYVWTNMLHCLVIQNFCRWQIFIPDANINFHLQFQFRAFLCQKWRLYVSYNWPLNFGNLTSCNIDKWVSNMLFHCSFLSPLSISLVCC